ncbi:hypothetical protein HN840_01155 [archaeon]|jgi:hypothetical protein|nr:hypothetical protein [archaeon]MBT5030183.1 hypothetical protein [archaeon]MBT5287698.1 hypothetical protein [archaeon]MBT7052855.1 hypothetical protein [archaeon]MBT7280915.1 hypothetical protein [archaeon]
MKKIIFLILVVGLLALAGCTVTTEETDESGVGLGAPTIGGKSSGLFSKVKKAFSKKTIDDGITNPADEIDDEVLIQLDSEFAIKSIEIHENEVADIVLIYSPEVSVRGAAVDYSSYLIGVELVGIDAIMQDFQTFIDSSTSGAQLGAGVGQYDSMVDFKNADGSYTTTYYNDVYEGQESGDSYVVNRDSDGYHTSEGEGYDNDLDDDGIVNSEDDDIDGDGENNDVDDDDDNDGYDDDEDDTDDDPNNDIIWESEGGTYLMSELLDSIMNEIKDQFNAESFMSSFESTAMMNEMIGNMNQNVGENVASKFTDVGEGIGGIGTLGGLGTGGTWADDDGDGVPNTVDTDSDASDGFIASIEFVSIQAY